MIPFTKMLKIISKYTSEFASYGYLKSIMFIFYRDIIESSVSATISDGSKEQELLNWNDRTFTVAKVYG